MKPAPQQSARRLAAALQALVATTTVSANAGTPESAPASAPASTSAIADPATAGPASAPATAVSAPPLPPKAEITALVKAGGVFTTGNAQTFTLSGAALFGYKEGRHKASADAGVALIRSNILVAIDDDAMGAGAGTIEENEIDREGFKATSAAFFLKGRYDFFIVDRLSAYLSAHVGGDRLAGKAFLAGGQVGGSYRLFKDEHHELVAELGYDITYERYVDADPNFNVVHSIRAFLGYTLKVNELTAVYANAEALFNLNKENVVSPDGNGASPFEDTRLVFKAGLSTKLTNIVAFNFGFTARYDNVPAPLPPFAIPYATGFVPLAQKLDTITEANLLITLL